MPVTDHYESDSNAQKPDANLNIFLTANIQNWPIVHDNCNVNRTVVHETCLSFLFSLSIFSVA